MPTSRGSDPASHVRLGRWQPDVVGAARDDRQRKSGRANSSLRSGSFSRISAFARRACGLLRSHRWCRKPCTTGGCAGTCRPVGFLPHPPDGFGRRRAGRLSALSTPAACPRAPRRARAHHDQGRRRRSGRARRRLGRPGRRGMTQQVWAWAIGPQRPRQRNHIGSKETLRVGPGVIWSEGSRTGPVGRRWRLLSRRPGAAAPR